MQAAYTGNAPDRPPRRTDLTPANDWSAGSARRSSIVPISGYSTRYVYKPPVNFTAERRALSPLSPNLSPARRRSPAAGGNRSPTAVERPTVCSPTTGNPDKNWSARGTLSACTDRSQPGRCAHRWEALGWRLGRRETTTQDADYRPPLSVNDISIGRPID